MMGHLFPLDANRPAWSNNRMSTGNRSMTREAEQAQAVLDNPAFKNAMVVLKGDAIDAILTAKTDTNSLLMARMKYDAISDVENELERIINTRAQSRE